MDNYKFVVALAFFYIHAPYASSQQGGIRCGTKLNGLFQSASFKAIVLWENDYLKEIVLCTSGTFLALQQHGWVKNSFRDLFCYTVEVFRYNRHNKHENEKNGHF